MKLEAQRLVELVEAAVNIRNECKLAIAAKDHLIPVPAREATGTIPARAAYVKDTGQLANAANNAFVLANNLIGQMRLINADAGLIKEAETLLNAPATAAAESTSAATV